MFEIENNDDAALRMIDFGMKGKVLFQLPVLGDKGLPMGITSSFIMFYDRFTSGMGIADSQVSSAWSYFIQTLSDLYPEATRQLARLDVEQLSQVVEYWVVKSRELAGFDPKA